MPRSDAAMKALYVELPETLNKRIRRAARLNHLTLLGLVMQALELWLNRYNKEKY